MIQEHQEDVKRPRDCELCLNKHAVWYCASDDAFLCHVCDESVHRANQVATKHERVCLKTNEISSDVFQGTTRKPVWHSWFRRKARTPRVRCEKKLQEKVDDKKRREDPRVPEIGGETNEDDEDLTSLVPEFQGFIEMELFLSNHDGSEETMRQFNVDHETDAMEDLCYIEEKGKTNGDEGFHEKSLMSCKNEFDVNPTLVITKTEENAKQRNMLLRLNYENVIAAWDKQESPRTATWNQNECNNASNFQLVPPGTEEKKVCDRSEREARVWRYRDKRKNRLFEKKIRYEVRKVNADKRPRMKGRFVRRSLTKDS
ncbi:Zinc finger protein CONSTANS-LIKE 8 [Hirschfeldia incana]|nr:Zinc finger protein CONSTANS-LIKE 8 [Hirschfeldia incana]KAJ0229397.1 Zinc finger protein CONSTANS-LIKE 8 [Hirschfeldia incana]